jgi:hypothetical protein
MGALHDASGGYYGAMNTTGHPANIYGWAAGGMVLINLPNFGAAGIANSQPNVDQLGVQATFSKGAMTFTTDGIGPWSLANGNSSVAAAWAVDGVYGTGSAVELTSAWSIYAGYNHLWTPNWRTSVYGGYLAVNYDGTATSLICGPSGAGGAGSLLGFSLVTGACNPDFKVWQAGTRTQWNPVSQLDVGIDVLYSHLDTAFAGAATTSAIFPASAGRPAGTPIAFDDQGVWSVMFRVQRNFWP